MSLREKAARKIQRMFKTRKRNSEFKKNPRRGIVSWVASYKTKGKSAISGKKTSAFAKHLANRNGLRHISSFLGTKTNIEKAKELLVEILHSDIEDFSDSDDSAEQPGVNKWYKGLDDPLEINNIVRAFDSNGEISFHDYLGINTRKLGDFVSMHVDRGRDSEYHFEFTKMKIIITVDSEKPGHPYWRYRINEIAVLLNQTHVI